MDVTVIETENKAHNVVPAQCKFVVDVRVNEFYTFEEILDIIKENMQSEVKAKKFPVCIPLPLHWIIRW